MEFRKKIFWEFYQLKIPKKRGRQYELEHCAVKAMRSILMGFMRQAKMLEKFKLHPSPEYALKVCFDYVAGGLGAFWVLNFVK